MFLKASNIISCKQTGAENGNPRKYFFTKSHQKISVYTGSAKTSVGPIKTLRRPRKSVFNNSTCPLVQQKNLNEKALPNSENDVFENGLCQRGVWWSQNCRDFYQKSKNHSFSQSQRDFWFKSFLLDQKYIVYYVNIRFLVIVRHCSSLLVIFRHFLPFWWYGKSEENSWKWAVRTSNDE